MITVDEVEQVDNVHSEIAEQIDCPTLPDLHWQRAANVNDFVLQDVSVHEVFCKLVAVPECMECYVWSLCAD